MNLRTPLFSTLAASALGSFLKISPALAQPGAPKDESTYLVTRGKPPVGHSHPGYAYSNFKVSIENGNTFVCPKAAPLAVVMNGNGKLTVSLDHCRPYQDSEIERDLQSLPREYPEYW